jgi:hypothetical protein
MKCMITVVLLLFIAGGRCWGQTTQPAADAVPGAGDAAAMWSQTVQNFADAVSNNDADALAKLCGDNVSVRSFQQPATEHGGGDFTSLLTMTNGARVFSIRAYKTVPAELASDVAADAHAAALSDAMLDRLTPDEGAAAKRANATAAQWVKHALGAGDKDNVGVIVSYQPTGSGDGNDGLIFILLHGGTDASSHITAVIFGDPRGSH